MPHPTTLWKISRRLRDEVEELHFALPVSHVYNPLVYAEEPHRRYLERYGGSPKEVLFLGMNPGPWGMAQTGVPFGEVSLVGRWLGIDGVVGKPAREHPKRPVTGFSCSRSEVSGRRVWTWAEASCGTPQAFFRRFFIGNYCPLIFLEEGGRNRTPDRLPKEEREALFTVCDRALLATVELLRPRRVVGFGKFAEGRAREALKGHEVEVGGILHPSPASPAANAGWAEKVDRQLAEQGIEISP